jgi:hypothetical protein
VAFFEHFLLFPEQFFQSVLERDAVVIGVAIITRMLRVVVGQSAIVSRKVLVQLLPSVGHFSVGQIGAYGLLYLPYLLHYIIGFSDYLEQ